MGCYSIAGLFPSIVEGSPDDLLVPWVERDNVELAFLSTERIQVDANTKLWTTGLPI